ncbi:hypothetical protein [Neorhizobium galegae]|uniref:hypothetical protein n=1 Tax=Neorhizobium galegae TaxID=399 RepID=UPI00059B7646|nr:hypothetical protein [Neorhizobium galegae]MCQ1854557.1 hypothetical protein [Neorhizobium galegae]
MGPPQHRDERRRRPDLDRAGCNLASTWKRNPAEFCTGIVDQQGAKSRWYNGCDYTAAKKEAAPCSRTNVTINQLRADGAGVDRNQHGLWMRADMFGGGCANNLID